MDQRSGFFTATESISHIRDLKENMCLAIRLQSKIKFLYEKKNETNSRRTKSG